MRGDVHEIKRPKDSVGHEQDGDRYAIVVQATSLSPLSTWIVCPTSASAPEASFRPIVDFGTGDTRVLVEQAAAVDLSRLGQQIGHLLTNSPEMDAIDNALMLVLGLR